ncbi:hypothetical protein R6Y90_16395 [Alteromonas macleodii]|uniref:hypothetical protein n=1 Tax=Alteromonas macleodii TaxID=28108 RepID=UPI002981C641|nr:hypothetical protein [Alteromonas macleodii]MDW5286543.1 hypothetical protein [Alteromonas macleodii]
MFNSKRTITATLVSFAMMGSSAMAQANVDEMKTAQMLAASASVQPESRTSESGDTWITLTGEVSAVDSKFFTLDYGDGNIFVELRDTDLDSNAYAKMKGEEVMVTARLDDGMFSSERLVAQSVIVDGMDTVYLAESVNQASADLYLSTASNIEFDDEEMVLVGTVKSIGKEALQIDVGDTTLTVELDELEDAPVDADGYLTLMKGERVRITGELEDDFFNRFTVEADTLIKMKS